MRLRLSRLTLGLVLALGACRSAPLAAPEPRPDAAPRPEAAAAREAPAPDPAARPAPPEPAREPPPEPDPRLALARRVVAERGGALAPAARESLARELARAERAHGLGVLLLAALIEQESHFRPRAEGPRGALGLMQVRPFVARAVAERHGLAWEGPATLLDPEQNVRIGSAYLAELRERFGSVRHALAAWNTGPTRLARRLERGASPEGGFAARVLARREALRRAFGRAPPAIGG